jgi:Ferritin-like domain
MGIRRSDTASMASLRAAAREVDEQHHEGMKTIHDELGELHFGSTGRLLSSSRRQFVKRAGLTSALFTLGTTVLPASRLLPAAWGQSEGGMLDDLTIAKFAQQVELAAVAAYQAAADTGKLDATATEVGTTFAGHHSDHAAAFGSFAGDEATDIPNQAVLDAFAPMIADAADQAALLEIAFQLEQGAASTYHFALGVLGPEAAAAVSTILPIEAQHAVVLGGFLGKPLEDYVPGFETSDAALSPETYPLTEN